MNFEGNFEDFGRNSGLMRGEIEGNTVFYGCFSLDSVLIRLFPSPNLTIRSANSLLLSSFAELLSTLSG